MCLIGCQYENECGQCTAIDENGEVPCTKEELLEYIADTLD